MFRRRYVFGITAAASARRRAARYTSRLARPCCAMLCGMLARDENTLARSLLKWSLIRPFTRPGAMTEYLPDFLIRQQAAVGRARRVRPVARDFRGRRVRTWLAHCNRGNVALSALRCCIACRSYSICSRTCITLMPRLPNWKARPSVARSRCSARRYSAIHECQGTDVLCRRKHPNAGAVVARVEGELPAKFTNETRNSMEDSPVRDTGRRTAVTSTLSCTRRSRSHGRSSAPDDFSHRSRA